VVPFRNAERFLGEAIESVVAQTYDDWELLLVDDGSTDGGAELARRYASEHEEMTVVHPRPDGRARGAAAARNAGIHAARGDYVAFLDADDVWSPRKLEEQTTLLESRPEVGMVYGVSCWWYSWTGRDEDNGRDYVEPLGVPAGVPLPPRSLLRPFFVLQKAAIPNPSSMLVRRTVTEAVGGFEEAVPNGHEDQAFVAKVCVHEPILAAERCWDRYRQHPHSLTATIATNGAEFSARAQFLTWLIGYLRAEGVDPRICRALGRQRFWYAHPHMYRLGRRMRRV
jgi:glycosyltransferase involved in cell wall biosynthesis